MGRAEPAPLVQLDDTSWACSQPRTPVEKEAPGPVCALQEVPRILALAGHSRKHRHSPRSGRILMSNETQG